MSDHIHPGPKTVESYPAVPDEVIDWLMHGAIDLHCHSGPSVMPRALNHVDAILEAQDAGMHAVLFKDHYYSVTPVVELLKETLPDLHITLISGVPLNNTVGGFNPYAVEHGIKLGARIVWMPTFSAANHLRHGHRHVILPTKSKMLRPTGLTVVTDTGELKDELKPILDQIAENDCVLSSGHLHISEIWPLFDEAKKRGVKRLLVNHPTFVIDASLSDIKELAAMGAYIEHSICMFINEAYCQKFFTGRDLKALIALPASTAPSSAPISARSTIPAGPRLPFRDPALPGAWLSEEEIRKIDQLHPCALVGLEPPATAARQAAE